MSAPLPLPDADCPACPREVRDLYACASNAIAEWRSTVPDVARLGRKLAQLSESVDRFEPVVGAHFAARDRDEGARPVHGARADSAEVRVRDLVPGDVIDIGGARGTVLGWSFPHPRYRGLALVLWWLDEGRFSTDALHPDQVLGMRVPQTEDERWTSIKAALP